MRDILLTIIQSFVSYKFLQEVINRMPFATQYFTNTILSWNDDSRKMPCPLHITMKNEIEIEYTVCH